MKRRRLDPLWVAKSRLVRALVAAAYLAAYVGFLLLIKDAKYALLWWSVGLVAAYVLYQLWWRWAKRELDRRAPEAERG
jgi:uncharacterized membrane protein YfcA